MKTSLGKKGLELFRSKAARLAHDGAGAARLFDEALHKAGATKGTFSGIATQLQTLMRLLRVAIKGEYRHVPWGSLVTGLAAILYFVNPLDLVPDFIAGVGLLDDFTVVAFALNALKADLDAFRAWEAQRDA